MDKGDADIRQDFLGGWLGDAMLYYKEGCTFKINILILLLNCSNGEKPTKCTFW
jgi:hypothetical protein